MPLHFITDVRNGEPDLIGPLAPETLRIEFSNTEGVILRIPAPPGGWSHDKLMEVAASVDIPWTDSADAFLGAVWIGSTEV